MKVSTSPDYADADRQCAYENTQLGPAGLDAVRVAELYGYDSPTLMGHFPPLLEGEHPSP